MKKTLSVILCAVMLANVCPLGGFAAPQVDFTVENASEVTALPANAAMSAMAPAPTAYPLYDINMGELVYFEDFEDGTASDAYNPFGCGAYIWSAGSVVDDPLGGGKAFVSGVPYTQMEMNGAFSLNATSATLCLDILNHDAITGTCPVAVIGDWLTPWDYWRPSDFRTDAWVTKSVTYKKTVTLTKANMSYYLGGKGLYLDNIRLYVKYDIGSRVRFVDGTSVSLKEGEKIIAPDPASDGNNIWVDEAGTLYFPGDEIPGGSTVVASRMPSLYDADKGELMYFEDFTDASWDNAYTIGKTAFYSDAGIVEAGTAYGVGMNAELSMFRTGVSDVKKLTFEADFRRRAGSDTVFAAVSADFSGGFDVSDVTEDKWSHRSFTVENVTLPGNGLTTFAFGFDGLYVDNITIYADYDIGSNVRLIDAKPVLEPVSGASFTFPAIAGENKNVWCDADGNMYLPFDTVDAASVTGKTYTAALKEYAEVYRLSPSLPAITADNGTVSVKPEISYRTGVKETDYSDIVYETDSACAAVTRAADGKLTLTGKINGELTVTAHLPKRITDKLKEKVDTLTLTIPVSGQSERIVGEPIRVMMIGNSIRYHGENTGLKWSGGRGMAATSVEKDYAHRFIYYLERKYGVGTAELIDSVSVDSFENAFAGKDAAANYAEVLRPLLDQIGEVKPDIVTLQIGDNSKNVTSAEAYANGLKQFIEGVKRVSPDSILVIATPFFGGGHQIDGANMAGDETGIPVAQLDSLYGGVNLAKNEYPAGSLVSGVDIHPGDTGMDNIAKMFYGLVNPRLTYRAVVYTTVPTGLAINGGALSVTEEAGTLALTAKVLPSDASQNVTWSLVSADAEKYAKIDADGLLHARNNGTVRVRAASKFKPEIYDEVDVTISGQSAPFTVTYNGNADDATVPEPNDMAKNGFDLTDIKAFASRPGYRFLGWAASPDGEVLDTLRATGDTTVYAVWEKAWKWTFDREGYAEDFTFANAFHENVTEGALTATATGTSLTNRLKVVSPELLLDADEYYALHLRMRNTAKGSDTTVVLTVTADGEKYTTSSAVSSVDMTDYYFDLSGVSGLITGFALTPTDVDCTVYIDEIAFLKADDAAHDEMPERYDAVYGTLVYFDNFSGEDFGNTADLVVKGPGKNVVAVGGRMAAENDVSTLGSDIRSGVLIGAADGAIFRYKDGRPICGQLTLVYDQFNASSQRHAAYTVFDRNPGGYDAWDGYYTSWSSRSTVSGQWSRISMTFDTSKCAEAGVLNTSAFGTNILYGSVAVYCKPASSFKLAEGDKIREIDAEGLVTYTFPEPSDDAYNAWSAGGQTFLAKEKTAAVPLIGNTFTSVHAKAAKIVYVGAENDYLRVPGETADYTPKTDNYPVWDISADGTERHCIGWSTEKDTSEPMTAITVTEAGVTLYPVWKKTADAVDYDITIDGTDTVVLDGTPVTIRYAAVFTPSIMHDGVMWSVDDESVARIDGDGLLTPLGAGVVTVSAKADYYPGRTASKKVTISYQEGSEPVKVHFTGDVRALPEDFTAIPGQTVSLSDYNNMKPRDKNLRFNGWILNGDAENVLTGDVPVKAGIDMTFTAVTNYDFNFAVPQTYKGYYNYGSWKQEDGFLVCTASGAGDDTFACLTDLAIPGRRFRAVQFIVDVNYSEKGEAKQLRKGDFIEESYFNIPGTANLGPTPGTVTELTEDGKYAVITIEMNSDRWTENTVTAIRCDFKGVYASYRIRAVHFVEKAAADTGKIELTDIDVPVTGKTPDTSVKLRSSAAKLDGVTWTCGGEALPSDGRFGEKTAYTVHVHLLPANASVIFGEISDATVNGREAKVRKESDGSITVSYTFDKTAAYLPFTAKIEGPDTVTRSDRAYTYRFVVSNGELPDKRGIFSVDDTSVAEITENGRLAVKKNGEVTIHAVSAYNTAVSASFTVKAEGIEQKLITVSFDKGTDADVKNMPAAMTVPAGAVTLPEEEPIRDGCVFLGWTDGIDSVKTLDHPAFAKDVTLYALWGYGILWNFNNSTEGFGIDNGKLTASDTYVIASTTAVNDIRLYAPVINIDPRKYGTVCVRLSCEVPGDVDVFYSPDNAGITGSHKITKKYDGASLDDFKTLTFDFSGTGAYKNAGVITRFWIDPFQQTYTSGCIDYIAVLDNARTLTFDAGDGTLPNAYKDGLTRAVGDTVVLSEKAVCPGKTFLGWSRDKDGENIVTTWTVREPVTLYAVYAEAVDGAVTLADDEVLLVKAAKGAHITISYTADGTAHTASDTANGNGYAIFCPPVGTPLTDISLAPEDAVMMAVGADAAEKTANAVTPSVKKTIGGGSTGGTHSYDHTVTDVPNENPLYTGDSEAPAVLLRKGDPLLVDFDTEEERNMFTKVSSLEKGVETSGVLTYRIFSKKNGSTLTPEMIMDGLKLDTAKYRYIILRAEAPGFENPRLRLYFTGDGADTYTKFASVAQTITDEYGTYIYDMSANKYWTGYADTLRFIAENNTNGTLLIDSILFTDTIPADMSDMIHAADVFARRTDGAMPFKDVTKSLWSYKDIEGAYQRGFVIGRSGEEFAPKDPVTVAEVITAAVRLNALYHGKELPEKGETDAWYMPFVERAKQSGVIRGGRFTEFDKNATRREVAAILSGTLPQSYLDAINMFSAIPDVPETDADVAAIRRLYAAGVVVGSDDAHNYYPDSEITREEFAAMLLRLAIPAARLRVYTEEERLASRKVYKGKTLNSVPLWSCVESNLKLGSDDIAWTASTTDSTDPIVLFNYITGRFDGSEIEKIRVGVKWDRENVKLEPQLYYGTATTPGHSGSRMIAGTIGEPDENGVCEVVFDVTKQSAFADIITDLRFDPFDLSDTAFGIAYLILE